MTISELQLAGCGDINNLYVNAQKRELYFKFIGEKGNMSIRLCD